MTTENIEQKAGDKAIQIGKVLGNVIINNPKPLSETRELSNLSVLKKRVWQFWIEGVLKKSIHENVLIELGIENKNDAVIHPWEGIIELPDKTQNKLPPHKKLIHIFDDVNRALLILGEPGSGKTMSLLELARDIIIQTEHNDFYSNPIPVIFNLSTWIDRKQPLIEWMANELTDKYYIPSQIGRP